MSALKLKSNMQDTAFMLFCHSDVNFRPDSWPDQV
jgi:hypothetical protein